MPNDNVPPLVRTEDASFVRDTHSKALLNTDRSALERHRAQRRKAQEADELRVRVQTLEERLEETHNLLKQALQRINAASS